MTSISNDPLNAQTLMQHIRALSDVIGGRPAGRRGEAQAREYVRHALSDSGIQQEVEEIPFKTPDTWGYAGILPAILALCGNLLGKRWRWLGGILSLLGALGIFWIGTARKSPFTLLAPSNPSATLVVRLAAKSNPKHKVVLIGHLDTNKHRLTFTPELKRAFRPLSTLAISAAVLNAVSQWFGIRWLRRWTTPLIASSIPLLLLDEVGDYVDGANDNATAVACLLGLGAHINQKPLENTEVWLAFTGAEEVGCVGMHALLDKYRVELANAWFIDFEMVGAGKIAYITEHSSLSHFGAYRPDDDSLKLAAETAQKYPELGVTGTPLTIVEEVGALRARGFRGICLAGVGDDGWLVNWHQSADNSTNIQPQCIETAARFALAMIETLNRR